MARTWGAGCALKQLAIDGVLIAELPDDPIAYLPMKRTASTAKRSNPDLLDAPSNFDTETGSPVVARCKI